MQEIFTKKLDVVPRKAAKFEKVVWNKKNTTFGTYSCKTGKCRDQTFFDWNMPRNCVGNMGWARFWLGHFNLWPRPFFNPKMLKIEQKTILFFIWKGEEIRPWFCNFWIARWLNFLPGNIYFFDFDLLHELNGPKVGQKLKKNLNFASVQFQLKKEFSKTCAVSVKKRIFQSFFKHSVPVLNTTSGASFTEIEPYFGELGPQKPLKWPNSWMLHHHENFWKFITWQKQMLWRWNLPQ